MILCSPYTERSAGRRFIPLRGYSRSDPLYCGGLDCRIVRDRIVLLDCLLVLADEPEEPPSLYACAPVVPDKPVVHEYSIR